MRLNWSGFKRASWNLGLITAGSVLTAVAVNGLLIPQGFVSGGFLGLSMQIGRASCRERVS
jgi:uncharacterized membrane-anchored protein YitT (DUF2179 family)